MSDLPVDDTDNKLTSLDLKGLGLDDSNYTHDDDDDNVAENLMSFLFDRELPTRLEQFSWTLPDNVVKVWLQVADDDDPGAIQSGHYLWPAAKYLADYIVCSNDAINTTTSIIELGAGCALASLTALQVASVNLQCLVVTDYDPGTLDRARDHYETTLEQLLNQQQEDSGENNVINSIASIPVDFYELEWGKPIPTSITDFCIEHCNGTCAFDLVLGSDLIYDVGVVEPLLTSATRLMNRETSRFWLCQSFAYDDAGEDEIDRACKELKLERTTLLFEDNAESKMYKRIQEYKLVA